MRYETKTRLPVREALERAEQYFGGEYGLNIQERQREKVRFEGGGGYVQVSVVSEQPTTLEIETREWDRPVEFFMEKLPR